MIVPALAASAVFAAPPTLTPLENNVRHELVMLPYLNLFDDISFRVDGSTVTLFGEVTQPVLKSEAGSVVNHLEGVTRVDNQIEVLPLSSMDDNIRARAYRAVFAGPLFRYSMGTLPPIHIIVKNVNVTLRGVVSNQGDSQIAYMRVNGLAGVFSVKNELQVVK